MITLPAQLILSLLLGLLAVGLLVTSLYLFGAVRRRPVVAKQRPEGTRLEPVPVLSPEARRRRVALMALALVLLLWPFIGRHVILLLRPSSGDQPQEQFGAASRTIRGASGAELAVEESGPADRPRILLTHGWGADRREWFWARNNLSRDFRVVTWDLPGLGQSQAIPNGDYAVETMARDLQSVLAATGDSPVILVGHSIGGMINLTFCRLFPQELGQRVTGIVQLNTTYTNPVKTTKSAQMHQALQKPVYEPLLHLITFISPVVRMLNWLSYQSGLAHLQTASQSFAGAETREELDFTARYYYRSSPAVVARGTLGMLHWDASDVLPRITVPVLIISGEQDKTTLPEASEHMERTIPGARRVSVSPAAHMGPIEQHERYNAAMREFAAQRLAGASGR